MAEQRPAASPGEPGIIVLSYRKIQDSQPPCGIDQSAVLLL
jgi:hypothetical protein